MYVYGMRFYTFIYVSIFSLEPTLILCEYVCTALILSNRRLHMKDASV